MEFVKKRLLGGQMCVQELLNIRIARVGGHEPVPSENAASVGVRNEERLPPGVEKDGVSRLRSQPFHLQELAAQPGGGGGKQRGERPSMSCAEEA